MGLFKPIETTKGRMSTISIKAGQYINCTDSKEIYMDTKDGRIRLGDVIPLETEAERENMGIFGTAIQDKLYMVKESSRLYRYDGNNWILVSNNAVVTIFKRNIRLTSSAPYVDITPIGFNPTKDSIMVYTNSVYLEEGEDYEITNNKMYPINSSTWECTPPEPIIFNFVLFKNAPSDGATIYQTRIDKDNTEISRLKSDNSMLSYIMMCSGMDMSQFLNYDKISLYFVEGLWDEKMVTDSIKHNVLTDVQVDVILHSI